MVNSFALFPPTSFDRATITRADALRIAASYSNPAFGPATAVLARFTDIGGSARNKNRLAWIVVRSFRYPIDVSEGATPLTPSPLCVNFGLTALDAHSGEDLVGWFAR